MVSKKTLLLSASTALLTAVAGCNGNGKSSLSISSPNISGTTSQKIINGVAVNPADAPQFVLIRIPTKDGENFCSGTVVGKEAVLSAAHCFTEMAAAPTIISGDQAFPSSSVAVHPSFEARVDLNAFFFDAAVLHVPGLSQSALPIASVQKVQPGDTAAVYGFGLTEEGSSEQLVSGSVTIDAQTPNHFVSKFDGTGSNPCFGDSGGPLLRYFVDAKNQATIGVIGIISSGALESCDEGDVTLYTSLQNESVSSFIAQNVPDLATF